MALRRPPPARRRIGVSTRPNRDDAIVMKPDCPHCRGTTAEAEAVEPSRGRCPVCGSAPDPAGSDLASGDARVFDEPGDLGLRLDGGAIACPVAFGPYRVLGVIGKGGMGVVYHARHEATGDEVAIKTVRVRKRGMLHRIRREIHALARIRHPGLVRIIETGLSDGLPWYAMELLRGRSLHDRMHDRRGHLRSLPFPPEDPTGKMTGADYILAMGAAESDPVLAALAGGPTATVGMDEPPQPSASASASKSETVDDATPETRAATTEDVPPISTEAPTLILLPPTTVEPAEGDGVDPASASVGRDPPGPIPEGELRDFLVLMSRLCGALAYLHGEGVVHRDIKPQNVIIRPDGTPVLLDFGLASYFGAGGRESLEVGGKVEGTPEYMSPEQIRGEYVDARADLYSVGCILYEGATGRVPFRARTPDGTLRAHVREAPIAPRLLDPEVPGPLDELIRHLLAKKANERLGYARDIIAALDRLGCAEPGWAARLPSRDYLYRPGFVGRGAVLAVLEHDVRRALGRPGHCIFLRGQSGVGKTRLIMEVARHFEKGGLTVVTCECLPLGVGGVGEGKGPDVRSTPLHPFRPLLQAVADYCVEKGPAETDRLLGARGRVLAECEPELAGLPGLADAPCPPCEDGDALQSRLVEALGEVLHEFGRAHPVVVFLDDLEWADALTMHFLALFHVGAWDSPNVAIVAAYRSEGEEGAIRNYGPVFQDASFVDIGPLEGQSLGQIVRDMLGSHDVDDRFVRHVVRRSGGNPFFVAEYLRAAVAEGLLYRDEAGRWRPRSAGDGADFDLDADPLGATIPLPDSLHELLVRRLSGLSDDSRRLLELAAVFGREIDADMIEAVELLGEPQMMAAVEALLVAQVLEESRDGQFRFAHDKIREVAYEQIPPPRRRALHRAVAHALEARHAGGDGRGRHSATLAHHWYRSIGDRAAEPDAVARAIGHLDASIGQAVNSGLTAEAVEFGRAAARLLGVDLPEGPAEIARAMTVEMGLIARALGGRRPGELLGLPASDSPEVDRAIGLMLTIQPPAFICNQIGLFALMASKNLTLTLAHGLGPRSPTVFAMYAIVERMVLDDARTAREYAGLAAELDRRGGGTQLADVSFLNGWFVDHWVAPIREILAGCDRGARAGLASGNVLYGCYNHAAYVTMLAASGEPLDRVAREAEARLALIGRRVLVARFHCVLERQLARALAGRTRGPTSLTDDAFDEARDLSFICRTTNINQVGYYHVARLKLHYYRGEHRQALVAAERARDVWESFARQPAEVELGFFRALALLATAPGEPEPRRLAAIEAARGALVTLRRWSADCPANFAHKALLVEADIARVERREDALRLYDEAARSASAARFLQHAALARELEARHLARLGHDAGAALQAAIEGYQEWGATALADRLSAI